MEFAPRNGRRHSEIVLCAALKPDQAGCVESGVVPDALNPVFAVGSRAPFQRRRRFRRRRPPLDIGGGGGH